ncbi:MAG: Eco57I restriction-modification methylase domain-containing protein, partial [bacterium]
RANWKESFRRNNTGKFDNIVGNPPYVKFQDLSDQNRCYLSNHWKTIQNGTFNLYFAFFELGYKLLNENGNLGYITPNNYFTSLAGESLRGYFQNKQCITCIVDFSHTKVFNAQTYTAITFLNKKKNPEVIYDRIEENQKPEVFLGNINGSPNKVSELNIKKWRLLKSDEQENIRIIETIGTPLNKLVSIAVGIATLKDELYFVDRKFEKNGLLLKVVDNNVFEIEPQITRNIYKISDFQSQEECSNNTKKIIFPYKIISGNAIPIKESELERDYPLCYRYFLYVRKKLQYRDKGKTKIEPFYAYGRTQGLTKTGKKMLTPTFSKYPRFMIVEDEEAFFCNGYGIYFTHDRNNFLLLNTQTHPLSKVENIYLLQKILNSYLMHYYVSKTSVSIAGGYPCYQKNFIEKFSIPQFTNLELETLASLKDPQEIDGFLIEKYQLNLLVPNRLS